MTDLEDQILKQNIPGRYSSWWKNEEHGEEQHDDSDNSCGNNDSVDDSNITQSFVEKKSSKYHQQKNSSSSSSRWGGVKGVLKDFELHQRYERQKNEEKQKYSSTNNTPQYSKPSDYLTASTQGQKKQSDVNQDDDESEEETDEFIQRYRVKQLEQWKEKAAQLHHTTSIFGEIVEVDPIQFAEIVDEEEKSNVPIFIHLYESCIPECIVLNTYLESLARSMSYARFLRLRAFAVDPAFEKLALPVLMVYKNGQLIGNFVRVCDEFESFTKENVKTFLESYCGTLPTPTPPLTAHNNFGQHPDIDDEELDEFCSDFHNNQL